MNAFAKLTVALALPLVLINVFGDIVAGIWLAVLREWRLLGYGLAAALLGGFVLTIALVLAYLLFDAPAASLLKKGHKVASCVFGFLSLCLTLSLLNYWCLTVFLFFVERADQHSLIPALLWSYGAAMAPVAWLAQKGGRAGNEYETVTSFFLQLTYIFVMLATLVSGLSPAVAGFPLFGIGTLVALVIEVRMAVEAYRAASRTTGTGALS